jgi:hypothetical protein
MSLIILSFEEDLVAVSTVDDADTIGDNDASLSKRDNLVADRTVVVHLDILHSAIGNEVRRTDLSTDCRHGLPDLIRVSVSTMLKGGHATAGETNKESLMESRVVLLALALGSNGTHLKLLVHVLDSDVHQV